MSSGNFRHQLIRGALIGFLLSLNILGWSVVGAHFFGYPFVTLHGSSMEPALRDGDILWMKYVDVSDVEVGNVVTLKDPAWGPITHRVIEIKRLSQERYLLVTKGDANWLTETWEISADETVLVSIARTPLAGYAVDFYGSALGRALIISLAVVIVVAMLLRLHQRRMAHGGG